MTWLLRLWIIDQTFIICYQSLETSCPLRFRNNNLDYNDTALRVNDYFGHSILLLIKALAKGQTPPSSIVRSAKMGYQLIPLLMPVVLIYFLIWLSAVWQILNEYRIPGNAGRLLLVFFIEPHVSKKSSVWASDVS